MSSKAMSLKAKIRSYAKNNHIAAQVVLQNYMFERFLDRLSRSSYQEKFVIKGGMLIAAIVGLDTRSTMDLDTTLRDLSLTEDKIMEAVNSICTIDIDDDVKFQVMSIAPIRRDDIYGGYCVRLDAIYDTIRTPLSIDISTGDIMTPTAKKYEFDGIFDDNVKIQLWGYNIETIMAEKIETIFSRGIANTRPRDFYDIYILSTTQKYDKRLFKEAFEATAMHRESSERIKNRESILQNIEDSIELQQMWTKYKRRFSYAENISYEDLMEILRRLQSYL